MENYFTAVLEDGTVGTIDYDTICFQDAVSFIGERVIVQLQDENGLAIEKSGILVEIL